MVGNSRLDWIVGCVDDADRFEEFDTMGAGKGDLEANMAIVRNANYTWVLLGSRQLVIFEVTVETVIEMGDEMTEERGSGRYKSCGRDRSTEVGWG